MSKGSTPRPVFIDMDKFEENWERIFGDKRLTDVSPGKGMLICTLPDKNVRCPECNCWKSEGPDA